MWTTCICSVFTRKFWSFPQLGHVSATRVSSLIANIVNSPKAIVGDGICWRNAELLSAAQKSWDLSEFARFSAFLHQKDRPASRVDDPRIDRGTGKDLPQCPQIQPDLLAILPPLASGLEFQDGERARGGFNDAIDRSADDPPVDRHSEGNFMQRTTRLIKDADVLVGADRLVGLDRRIDDALEVINFSTASHLRRDLTNRPRISDARSRITDPDPLKQPMHKRSDETTGCGRRWLEAASPGFRRHHRCDGATRRRCVGEGLERCDDAGIRDSGFGIR